MLEKRLPVEMEKDQLGQQPEVGDQGLEPWLLYSMAVGALNFCAFAMCVGVDRAGGLGGVDEALLAVPNALDTGGVDFFHLPNERRVSVLRADEEVKTGMVMALSLFRHPGTGLLKTISGYEDGCSMIHQLVSGMPPASSPPAKPWVWQKILVCRPHSQPVLSLDVAPSRDVYFSSSVDAIIAKIAIPACSPGCNPETKPVKTIHTKHAGQQGLNLRSDGKIFATAGWDARIRVYSSKTLNELAVLKWHQDGCYSTAFAEILTPAVTDVSSSEETKEITRASSDSNPALKIIKEQRSSRAQRTHWLAAGGKDGKVSLWDIY